MLTVRSRIEETIVESVSRQVKHSLIFVEYVACSITNVHIPIENTYLFDSQLSLCISCSDSDIVKEEKSSTFILVA